MENNDTLITILGIILMIIVIMFSLGISQESNRPSSCPEADCYIEIWP